SHMLQVEFLGSHAVDPRSDAATRDSRRPAPLAKVAYQNLWNGVSLSYDAPAGGIARSTYRIEPKADLNSIRLCYNAAVALEKDGSLRVDFATGAMKETAPEAWQERDGKRVPVSIAFAMRGKNE